MTNINSINYLAMEIKGKNQLGSAEKAAQNGYDLTDGLSEEELKLIDKDKDGSIKEEEFKQTFGAKNDSYKTYWDALKSFHNSKCKKTETGTQETSIVNNENVTSTYDSNGILTGYTKTTEDSEGIKTIVSYTVEKGVATKSKTRKINADNTEEILNNKTGVTTKKYIDGTAISTDKDGNLKTLTTADSNTKINFSYDEKGNIKKATVTINGTKIYGSKVKTSKDGKTTTISNSSGKIVAKYHTDADNQTFVTAYTNGVKSKCFKLDDKNEPVYVNTYATAGSNKGKVSQREFCETGVTRKYKRGSNGKVATSTDYINGEKYSSQTYNSTGNWATRTLYDKDGNVTAYQEYKYEKNDKNVITDRVINKYSDNSKKELIATYTDTLDENGNKLTRIIEKPNEYTETIEYKYNDAKNKKLVQTISNKGNIYKETDYEDEKKINERKTTIVDGKSTVQTTHFDYYGKTDRVQNKLIKKDDGSVLLYQYSPITELLQEINVKKEISALKEQLENVNEDEKAGIEAKIKELENLL